MKYLSVKEVATKWGYSEATVRKWCKEGLIKVTVGAEKKNGHWQIPIDKAFENKKLNMVNQRREFFNVTLDEIKEVVMKNFDKSVEFIEVPEAEQYRTSLKMKEKTHN